ncbi:MAG TPA: RNA polymerase sigma factor [Actinomycetota bacterium]|nr:RNA polymerase sigma factor [Actinomycetota bacterium]
MTETRAAIDAVWRIESPKLIAGIAHIVRDVGLAEDFAHDALVAALEQWPRNGIPANPGAWLMTTAKRRAIDYFRRNETQQRKYAEIATQLEEHDEMRDPEEVEDDLLRLLFIACHPVLSPPARVALTLRLIGGLTTDEVARAFLVPESTVAQRIVRAKRTLTEARVPFELPGVAERADRLASVLEVIYLIFNEGYAATQGEHWVRPDLCEDALRVGRVLAELVSKEPEVHGLVALMELQASRLRARVGPTGEPVLLLDQDRARWDRLLIQRGLRSLARAEELGPLGPYGLQAAIAACHARAYTPEETDWMRIVALYDALAQIMPTPVVELNRAVAVAMAYGPAAGLDIVEQLAEEPALQHYHLLPSVRGDLLEKLGRRQEAREQFALAAAMTRNERERVLLQARAQALNASSS